MTSLEQYGWTIAHQAEWNKRTPSDGVPARVIADFGTSLKLATPSSITAEPSGKLAHYTDKDAMPKVGDWVSVIITDNNAVIESVICRKNEIARKVAGKRVLKQIIAANVDIAFVLLALDNDFSIERLHRFLYQLSVSAVKPIIVLNKADKPDDVQQYVRQIKQFNHPIVVAEANEGIGIAEIARYITPACTAILLGSSGVGKSTITNQLLGREAQQTNTVRESDATGRHTTVHRELFILPNGGILIDTPGIRELQLWGSEDELETGYDNIAELTRRCKFSNCRHNGEDGCAIALALTSGELSQRQYSEYVRLKDELARLETKRVEQVRLKKQRTSRQTKDRIQRERSNDRYTD